MPVPTRFLLGSPLKLGISIALFVLLELSVLVINLWVSDQMADDAVAINLAGRQRMLSQQITKSLLQVKHAPDAAAREAPREELADAFQLFATTLRAFDQGGMTTGGDGKPVYLHQVDHDSGREPLEAALGKVAPVTQRLGILLRTPSASVDDLRWVTDYMVANNREILARMNDLAFALEQHSIRRIEGLRAIQSGALLLSMLYFLFILLSLVKQYHAEKQGRGHWREIAQRDPLTGLFNRTALREALDRLMAEADREGRAFSLLLLDLDDFKPVNDLYGHAAGDALLRNLAECLLHDARDGDAVARLGGDEFALVCPNLHSSDNIRDFCDRVLASIAALGCGVDTQHYKVHASIGVAVYPSHGNSPDELLAAADHAMYLSKRQGGNRWTEAELNR